MYRITYEQGNGYHCSCCRRTYTETYDVETAEEVQDWVNELYADYKFPRWENADDRIIISIEKEIGVDIKDQFKPQSDVVDSIIAARKVIAEEKKQKQKEELEKNEYNLYLKLKDKFEFQNKDH